MIICLVFLTVVVYTLVYTVQYSVPVQCVANFVQCNYDILCTIALYECTYIKYS